MIKTAYNAATKKLEKQDYPVTALKFSVNYSDLLTKEQRGTDHASNLLRMS